MGLTLLSGPEHPAERLQPDRCKSSVSDCGVKCALGGAGFVTAAARAVGGDRRQIGKGRHDAVPADMAETE
jgi:hypothetical protein